MFHVACVPLGSLCLLLLTGCDRGRADRQMGKPEPLLARVDEPLCKHSCSGPLISRRGGASKPASTVVVGSIASDTVSRARSEDEFDDVPILFSASDENDALAADLIDFFG